MARQILTRCFWPPESEIPCATRTSVVIEMEIFIVTYPLTNLGHVAIRQHVKIRLQARIMDRFPIPFCLERSTKTNIVANRGILLQYSDFLNSEIVTTYLNPGALGAIRHRSTDTN